MKFNEFILSKGYNAEQYAGLEVTKQAELQSEFLSEVSNKLETKANKNDLDAINAKISKATTQEDLKKATEEIESLALKVAKITENGGSGSTRNTFKKIVEEQVKSNKGKDLKDTSLEVVVKADILFNIAATAAGGNFPSDDANVDANILFATAIDLGFAQRLSREATILNKLSGATPLMVGEALKVTVPYDQTGTPIRVTEAKGKTTIAVKFQTEKKESEKLPIVFYISEEFMNRADYLVAEIQNYMLLLLTEVLEQFVFDATSGVLSYAQTFTTIAGLEITDANEYDALNAVATTMTDAKFMPDTVVMNTVDVAKMFGAKGTDGHYSLANGGSIRMVGETNQLMVGNKMLDLIEVDSDIIAAGTFAMCDWPKLRFGLGDFVSKANPYTFMRDNVVENVIEAPFAVMLPSNYAGAVISDTFANVITDITPA